MVKRAYFAHGAEPWLVKITLVLRALSALAWKIGPLMISLLMLGSAPTGPAAQIFLAAVVVLFVATMAGGLHHNWNRYLYVFTPVLIAGLAYARAHRHTRTAAGQRP